MRKNSEQPMTNYGGAGLILLSPARDSVLLVCDLRSKKWGFPKGHREPEDVDPVATATRECMEETAIDPSKYTLHGPPFRIAKSSGAYMFFYATAHTTSLAVSPQASEIETIAWIPLRELSALNGNKYLRVWATDLLANTKRKSVELFHQLAGLEPPRLSHSVAHA